MLAKLKVAFKAVIHATCSHCNGSGWIGDLVCPGCNGSGNV